MKQREQALKQAEESCGGWTAADDLPIAFEELYHEGKLERRRADVRETGMYRYRLTPKGD